MGEIGIVVIIANLFGQLRIGVCVMQRRCMGKSSILALVDCGNHAGRRWFDNPFRLDIKEHRERSHLPVVYVYGEQASGSGFQPENRSHF